MTAPGFLIRSKSTQFFLWFAAFYAGVVWVLIGMGEEKFEHLHLGLDTSNGIMSLLLAIFLWGNLQLSPRQRLQRYLALSFAFAAATELLHALVGIEWVGAFAWIDTYSNTIRPATWPPSTYVLPIALAYTLWLKRQKTETLMGEFIIVIGLITVMLFALSFNLPRYMDTGILGIQRPTQVPLVFLWAGLIVVFWRERHIHPLFEGIALMGVFLLISDLFMLYSTSPHEKFTMMAHSGKLVSYALLHVILMQTAAEDAEARKEAEESLFVEKDRLQVTLDSIGDAVITTDTSGNVTYLNPVAEKLTGWRQVEAKGVPLERIFNIINEYSRESVENPVEKVLREHRIVGLANHTLLLHRDGAEYSIEDSAAPIHDRTGEVIGVMLVFHDVSFARKAAAELEHQATHDTLTGLINRREFENQVNLTLKSMGRYHTVLFLDLDQFKIVNDTCGHVAGDELLRQVALLMQSVLRDNDVLARLGGDEFAVLLQNCPLAQSEHIAEKLRVAISSFRFVWQDNVFNIGVSIGLVNFSDTNYAYEDVMKVADTACYLAKDMGRNRIYVHKENDSDIVLRRGEMDWVGRIHSALSENRFVLYRQEIQPLRDQAEGCHCEILLRMIDEKGNLILPMAFLPAAERYNLMPMIDRWVFTEMMSRLASGPTSCCRNGDKSWSINLSGASINDDTFLEFIKGEFARFNVPPSLVCFEITETVAITNLTRAGRFIHELRTLGCGFSLDDFGSGMSSFTYLKYLEVDCLKIDGKFVRDIAESTIDYAMVESINKIGHLMGMKTTAEFVENDRTKEILKEMGVDYVQGFGIHLPSPL